MKKPVSTPRKATKTRNSVTRKSAQVSPAANSLTRGERTAHEFDEVLHLIESARHRAFQAVNVELIDLYWNVGGYVSGKVAAATWGRKTIETLATFIQRRQPGIRGFSASNIWRMRQFFETYDGVPILAPLVRELGWTQHLIIMGRCKLPEEREFYLRMAAREGWGKRDLSRQIGASLFERTVLPPPKLSTVLREMQPAAAEVFKDSYVLEFLGLPEEHSEADLHHGLLTHLRRFITELGRDFCFIGSEVPLQVGKRDFALDLLFFHRGMNCLVAFELKLQEFEPEHLGKLGFYLEALDRDIKKPHENPSIGVLLCASKDSEVVEYALSRSLSPALIAEYQTQLPDRALLQRKLHEFYQQLAPSDLDDSKVTKPKARAKR